ncbi:23S rRNA (adenine(2503)-C(2))-methyltransferase RlmN [candidate division KSB1 bacterium]|nr:23S rRNA (adenine(2503)-C(2))-methyltransferase RlmN [candidate division KSB1 bacterium]
MEKLKIKDQSLVDLEEYISSLGEKKYRAKQIYEWIYVHNIADFSAMKNIPKGLGQKLEESFVLHALEHVTTRSAPDHETMKFLFRLADGHLIETVLMFSDHGRTICVSTQVGCPIDCQFCATGLMGLKRNLTPGEILDQVLMVERLSGEKITNIVVMGMGEPFLNYDNLMQALDILTDEHGKNMARKKIVVSTSGVIPKIERFIAENRKYRLAISLNAATDDVRNEIMPLNKKWPLRQLLGVAKKYTQSSRQRITFEYVLLKGVNDSLQDARNLRKIVQDFDCILNLIPFNTTYSIYKRPDKTTILAFYNEFSGLSKPVTIRWSKGTDIDAACGQLVTREGSEPLRNEKKRAGKIAGANAE